MPNQQGLSPSVVNKCSEGVSRVLYINLGDNQENRSNKKKELHPLILNLGWTSPPGRGAGPRTASQFYYMRNDRITDQHLAENIQIMLDGFRHKGFEFAIFKPVYTKDKEDCLETFNQVFGMME
ncbi:unnamed protein product [Auanema sp. JU1783]|nr:unnamed protein product [Auanema sp. JU1783]